MTTIGEYLNPPSKTLCYCGQPSARGPEQGFACEKHRAEEKALKMGTKEIYDGYGMGQFRTKKTGAHTMPLDQDMYKALNEAWEKAHKAKWAKPTWGDGFLAGWKAGLEKGKEKGDTA